MRKSPFEELVEAAFSRMPAVHTEDVTHDVFDTIENDPALLREYKALLERFHTPRLSGRANVNQSITYWVMKKTGRSTLSKRHPSPRSTLIQTYSKLG